MRETEHQQVEKDIRDEARVIIGMSPNMTAAEVKSAIDDWATRAAERLKQTFGR